MGKLYYFDENTALQSYVDNFYHGLEIYCREQTYRFKESMKRLGYTEEQMQETSRVYLNRKFNRNL